jgi:hypothetical protein
MPTPTCKGKGKSKSTTKAKIKDKGKNNDKTKGKSNDNNIANANAKAKTSATSKSSTKAKPVKAKASKDNTARGVNGGNQQRDFSLDVNDAHANSEDDTDSQSEVMYSPAEEEEDEDCGKDATTLVSGIGVPDVPVNHLDLRANTTNDLLLRTECQQQHKNHKVSEEQDQMLRAKLQESYDIASRDSKRTTSSVTLYHTIPMSKNQITTISS